MTVGEKARILIVEDEIITAKAIEQSLKNMGYDVVGLVSSGEEAVERAARIRPDLVLMDVRLKGVLDGVRATQKIQASLDIPVVYLTAHSDDETVKRILHSHAYGCVFKPFKKEDLHNAVERALTRRKSR